MKEKIEIKRFHTYSYPKIVVLVTMVKDGRPNIITLAWHSPVSIDPPLYGIGIHPKRVSHDAILDSKEFVVNFPPMDILDKVHFCGRISGRDEDKFGSSGLTAVPSEKVGAPLIEECYANLECKVVEHVTLGDHTWIVGEILSVHADKEKFENELVKDTEPVYYVGKDIYTTISDKREKVTLRNR